MDSHLVAVEVSVKCGADQRMNLNRGAVNQYRFKSLDTEAVQGRSAVEQDGALFDYFFQNVIDFRFGSFYLSAGALDIVGQPCSIRRRMTKGLKSSNAIRRGRPHWCNFSSGPTTITERPL
jgi:hypothetical protein